MSSNTYGKAQASQLRQLLRAKPGHDHLDVEARGDHLTVFTLEEGKVVRLARLTSLPRDEYGLSLMWHTGRWEPIPVAGSMEELVGTLSAEFNDWLAAAQPP